MASSIGAEPFLTKARPSRRASLGEGQAARFALKDAPERGEGECRAERSHTRRPLRLAERSIPTEADASRRP